MSRCGTVDVLQVILLYNTRASQSPIPCFSIFPYHLYLTDLLTRFKTVSPKKKKKKKQGLRLALLENFLNIHLLLYGLLLFFFFLFLPLVTINFLLRRDNTTCEIWELVRPQAQSIWPFLCIQIHTLVTCAEPNQKA